MNSYSTNYSNYVFQPRNGGSICPHLTQSKQCRGMACYQDDPDDQETPGLDQQFFVSKPGQEKNPDVEHLAEDESEIKHKSK